MIWVCCGCNPDRPCVIVGPENPDVSAQHKGKLKYCPESNFKEGFPIEDVKRGSGDGGDTNRSLSIAMNEARMECATWHNTNQTQKVIRSLVLWQSNTWVNGVKGDKLEFDDPAPKSECKSCENCYGMNPEILNVTGKVWCDKWGIFPTMTCDDYDPIEDSIPAPVEEVE